MQTNFFYLSLPLFFFFSIECPSQYLFIVLGCFLYLAFLAGLLSASGGGNIKIDKFFARFSLCFAHIQVQGIALASLPRLPNIVKHINIGLVSDASYPASGFLLPPPLFL